MVTIRANNPVLVNRRKQSRYNKKTTAPPIHVMYSQAWWNDIIDQAIQREVEQYTMAFSRIIEAMKLVRIPVNTKI